ncbi:hypothetical protein B0H19DRAFT_1377093, partial [Mycena capillaripes]
MQTLNPGGRCTFNSSASSGWQPWENRRSSTHRSPSPPRCAACARTRTGTSSTTTPPSGTSLTTLTRHTTSPMSSPHYSISSTATPRCGDGTPTRRATTRTGVHRTTPRHSPRTMRSCATRLVRKRGCTSTRASSIRLGLLTGMASYGGTLSARRSRTTNSRGASASRVTLASSSASTCRAPRTAQRTSTMRAGRTRAGAGSVTRSSRTPMQAAPLVCSTIVCASCRPWTTWMPTRVTLRARSSSFLGSPYATPTPVRISSEPGK